MITYVLNGGTQATGQVTSFVDADLPITLLNPTKANYRFLGWYDNSSFQGSSITQVTTSGNKTLYAKWIEEYLITYVLNGGRQAENQITTFVSGDTLTILNPTKAGFQFDGWFDNSAFNGSAITSTTGLSANITLYAKWTQTVDYAVETNGNTITLTTDRISSSNTVSIRDYINMEFTGANPSDKVITRIDITYTYTTQRRPNKENGLYTN